MLPSFSSVNAKKKWKRTTTTINNYLNYLKKSKTNKQPPAFAQHTSTSNSGIWKCVNCSIKFCIVIISIVSDASHFVYVSKSISVLVHRAREWNQAEINILTCFCCSGSESSSFLFISFHSFSLLFFEWFSIWYACTVHQGWPIEYGLMVRRKQYHDATPDQIFAMPPFHPCQENHAEKILRKASVFWWYYHYHTYNSSAHKSNVATKMWLDKHQP